VSLYSFRCLSSAILPRLFHCPEHRLSRGNSADPHPENRRHGPQRRPLPARLDAKAGKLYLEIPKIDQDFLLLDQLPYGIAPTILVSTAANSARAASCTFRASAAKCCSSRAQSDLSLQFCRRRRAHRRQGVLRRVVLWGFKLRQRERPSARRRHRFFPARCPRRRRDRPSHWPGQLPPRPQPQRHHLDNTKNSRRTLKSRPSSPSPPKARRTAST